MNGRVYDPLTAQFFSPDPNVQAPGDWLNYNRYAYGFNNPMKYTDPSGNSAIPYIGIGLGWSYNSGLTVSLSFGFTIGVGSAGITVGYGFGNNNFFATVNASAAGFYAYGGYDSKGGWIYGGGFGAGYYFGMGASMYSGKIGFSVSTNIIEMGFSHSENGGWAVSAFGYQYTRDGLVFDPSLGVGFNVALTRQQQQTIPNDNSLEVLAATVKEMVPDVVLADGPTDLLSIPDAPDAEYDAGSLSTVVIYGHRSQSGVNPIDDPYIGSDYGVRGKSFHHGVDLINKNSGTVQGKPIYSVTSGRIVRLVTTPDGDGGGVRVRIQSSEGYQYNYMHMQVNSNSHLKGVIQVNKGDFIGRVGNTGHSTGPHLHFEIWAPNGAKINPYSIYPNLYSYPHR